MHSDSGWGTMYCGAATNNYLHFMNNLQNIFGIDQFIKYKKIQ